MLVSEGVGARNVWIFVDFEGECELSMGRKGDLPKPVGPALAKNERHRLPGETVGQYLWTLSHAASLQRVWASDDWVEKVGPVRVEA